MTEQELLMPDERNLVDTSDSQLEVPNDPLLQTLRREVDSDSLPGYEISHPEPLFSQENGSGKEIFRCLNLTKSYGQGISYNEVVKGINFTVEKGEYIIIYGPSGSGKSTLLNLLAGLEVPSRGEIRVRGQAIHTLGDDDMAIYHREHIGLVFQNFNLLPSLRVWENVSFPLMLAGAPQEWRRHEAMRILTKFGLEEFAGYYPNQLSGGQQQRVALARALVHDPEILLVDEPTGNLDSASAQTVIQEIERLHKQEERTIILVTHSEVFLPYATRIFYIKDGTLLHVNEQSSLNTSV
ncbi:MAG: transporter related protein [Patescibacteria group bacterium]|jgi:putative ABC transport system ATP-binding protein|nr:transporter related protein [Patescibacteria group bacterium]